MHPPEANAYHQTTNQPVILSGEKRLRFAKSNFRGLSEANKRKQGAKAPQGSRNKFWWLAFTNVTSTWKATEIRNEIPLRLVARDFSSLFAQKNFDKLRMTYSGIVPRLSLEIGNHIFFFIFLISDTKNFIKNKIRHCFLTKFVVQ